MADSETHEVRNVADFELGHDAAAISVDGAGLYADQGSDFLARFAFDDELEHLPLARTKAVQLSRFQFFVR